MKTLSLQIPAMKSSHCQMTVTNVLSSMGAKVQSIEPGKIVIDPSDFKDEELINAIEQAGYKIVK